jgi:hypothetical protein
MARIKHIAIRTTDPEKTSAFSRRSSDSKRSAWGLNGIFQGRRSGAGGQA